MGCRQKLFHLLYAFRKSLFLLCISLLVTVLCAFLLAFRGTNQLIVFLTGVASSIVATNFLYIFEKCGKSCTSFSSILDDAFALRNYLKDDIFPQEKNNGPDKPVCLSAFKFRALALSDDIRLKSQDLTWKVEYEELVLKTNAVVSIIYNNGTFDDLRNAYKELVAVLEYITHKKK